MNPSNYLITYGLELLNLTIKPCRVSCAPNCIDKKNTRSLNYQRDLRRARLRTRFPKCSWRFMNVNTHILAVIEQVKKDG